MQSPSSSCTYRRDDNNEQKCLKSEKLRPKFRGFNLFCKGVSLSDVQIPFLSNKPWRHHNGGHCALHTSRYWFLLGVLFRHHKHSTSTSMVARQLQNASTRSSLRTPSSLVSTHPTSPPEQTYHEQWLDQQYNSLTDFSLRPLHSPPTHSRNKHLPQQPRPLHNSHSRRSLRQ